MISATRLAVQSGAQQSEGGTVTGTVQDDRGTPVADVKVTISSKDFSASTLTRADGKFEFKSLKPAQYVITAETSRFRKETTVVNITKPEDALTPVIKLAFSSLHVTVFDANSQPLGGVSVSVRAKETTASNIGTRTTDESGDVYFGRLAPGSYLLTATLRGYDEYRSEVFISNGITTELPLRLLVAPLIPINEKNLVRFSLPKLPSKNVQTLFQDSEGWIWFGTDKGIARFNGAEFKSSAANGSTYDQLNSVDIRSIIEDSSRAIWIATSRGVRRITQDGIDAGGLLDNLDARRLAVDSRNNVWVATPSGLFRFDGNIFKPFSQGDGLPSDDVRATVEDKEGNIWVATAKGIAVIEGEKVLPLSQFLQSHSENRDASATQSSTSDPMADAEAQVVFADKSGKVWFATSKGVAFFDGNRVVTPSLPASRSGTVRAMAEDRMGRILMAFSEGGTVLYDATRNESQLIASLDRDRVAALLVGREGEIWLATDEGAIKADFYSFVNFASSRGLPDNDVRAIVEQSNTSGEGKPNLFFATAAGVSRIENERFVPVEGFRANTSVRGVTFDRTGAAWFATDRGATRLSGQTLTQFNESNGLASNSVHWVTTLKTNPNVVFATARGATIYKDGVFESPEALAGYDVKHVLEDTDGILWLATSRGVLRYDQNSGESDLTDTGRGLIDNDVRWITRFNDRLLVATRGGVQAFSDTSRRRPTITTFDGEPATTLYVDRDGFLWIGSEEGKLKKFAQFGNHLIQAEYSADTFELSGAHINGISEDSAGNIWVATDEGAVRHQPARIAPIVETWLKLDGTPVITQESQPCDIPYGRHKLSFQFTAASMTGQVKYLYRINPDQGDETWEQLPVQQGVERGIERFDLGEGLYGFEVVALNRDLYGATTPTTTLSLRVGSPFWKRWWFYALLFTFAGFFAGAILLMNRIRNREYFLPKELKTYLPVEPNPYIVGNPIRSEKMFYGREDDFRYVRTKLEGASQGMVIVFCGERRVGKSSILYQLLNGRLGERFIPVFVDMQEMVIANDSEFFSRVSRLIAESVSHSNQREIYTSGNMRVASGARSKQAGGAALAEAISPTVSVPQFDGRNPYPIFIDFLDDVLEAIGDRTLLILVDEYELMESKVDEGKISPDFFTFLAGLMDNKERLAFVFTGSRRLEERDKKYWRELLRRSLFRKVSFLTEKDTVRLITEPVTSRVVYGRGVIDVICRLTAGQPFYTQVICQNIVDYLNEHEQNWVTLANLKQVIADVIDNPLPQMIYTWDALSDDEKIALSLLAEVLPDGVYYATSHELRASVKANDYPVKLSENTIRLNLEEMFHRELLEKNAFGGFRFKIDLFRLWIRRSHSIWQVVKEVRTH
jgi:ligand-binding sensor domain-containing protein/AAA+ ATPase superfamily predicted ATPase